MSKLKIAKAEV